MSVTARSMTNYQVEIQAGRHTFVSDEPLGIGDDAGPDPFQLLLSGLASCTVITLQMYARRKSWPLEGVTVEMDIQSDETRTPAGERHRSSQISMKLTFQGDLTAEQMQRLEEIAHRCPVHRTLKGDIQVVSSTINLQKI
jgi:putative redox protein